MCRLIFAQADNARWHDNLGLDWANDKDFKDQFQLPPPERFLRTSLGLDTSILSQAVNG